MRIIFDLYLKGKGYHYIISQLNSLGYKTREGRKFGKNSLYDILRNPKYCGTYTFNKVNKDPSGKRNSHKISENAIIVDDAIPAIISKEDFRKVQEKMSRNKHRTAAYRSKETYLLTGKAFCGICGAAMTGHRASARGKKYVYYTCAARDRLGISACENKVVPRDELEQVVLDTLKEELLSNNFQKNLNHYILEEFHTLASEVSNEADSLAEQKAIAERKLNNLYSIIEQGTADEYDLQRLADVKRELTSIKEKLSKCAAAHSLSDINPRAIERTIKLCRNMLLKNASAETLTLIFDDMVEKIVIGAKKITLQFKLECFDTYGAEGRTRTGTWGNHA
ncbi:recombinase family protein [Phascolarctobacterium faecium]|uniref:recombinase family protein n=1 Tax=Phascolarctobacterium faecium TaxID=33025 RepID=UPI00399AD4C2